jgi:uncharacterized membrane protein
MNAVEQIAHRLREDELKLLTALRMKRRAKQEKPKPEFSVGDQIADKVAATMGSWNFIII